METEEQAVREIKQTFANEIVLAYPDFKRPFYLNTDASLSAVAGELYQIDVGETPLPTLPWHPAPR